MMKTIRKRNEKKRRRRSWKKRGMEWSKIRRKKLDLEDNNT